MNKWLHANLVGSFYLDVVESKAKKSLRATATKESGWSSPPINTRNLRGVTSALPVSCLRIEYLRKEDTYWRQEKDT
ncbi:hypothetical protein EVAR_7683_1 [Eumeta japonica]|uniref:Uncharacterized protein n=1 Tax=Eumeta variegata TaxID=151549 RepID=A0A4C1TIB8_EUMVA|nr:hypothetical protein EVAR_7683_1 [Eumeta japonica]